MAIAYKFLKACGNKCTYVINLAAFTIEIDTQFANQEYVDNSISLSSKDANSSTTVDAPPPRPCC